jgi:phosphatidylserine decarboxylase
MVLNVTIFINELLVSLWCRHLSEEIIEKIIWLLIPSWFTHRIIESFSTHDHCKILKCKIYNCNWSKLIFLFIRNMIFIRFARAWKWERKRVKCCGKKIIKKYILKKISITVFQLLLLLSQIKRRFF